MRDAFIRSCCSFLRLVVIPITELSISTTLLGRFGTDITTTAKDDGTDIAIISVQFVRIAYDVLQQITIHGVHDRRHQMF